jgi:hypothetical protein
MAEQPTTLFDAPAGDRPASPAYQPGTWLAEAPPTDPDGEAPSPSAEPRLRLHRLLDAERRLAGRHER